MKINSRQTCHERLELILLTTNETNMKTRLPKMLLTALLAAMTSAYALPTYVTLEGVHQHYQGDPIVITDAADFGSGISSDPASTVSIGYGDNVGVAYDANFTLSGDDFTTPNALFIGGPGWPHTLTEGYETSKGVLTIDDATLTVASNILMGTCTGAWSDFFIQGGSQVYAVNMQVSNGGGYAFVNVGSSENGSGYLHLDGHLAIGTNNKDNDSYGLGHMNILAGSQVDVEGITSIGYDGVDDKGNYFPGSEGMLHIEEGGILNTGSLEMGIGSITEGAASVGEVTVAGTLNVTGSDHETLIGINGGTGGIVVIDGGVAKLGVADVRVGSTTVDGDTTQGTLVVKKGSLTHGGTMYVGDKGTVAPEEEGGDPYYGVGYLKIQQGGTAKLNIVEVSEDSTIYVDGKLTVDETPDKDGIQGVRLYHGAILSGTPDNQGGTLSFSVVPEVSASGERQRTDIVIDTFTLTSGTTLKTCCDAHLIVGDGSTLTFGEGTLWLTNGIAYIDAAGQQDAGTITANGGTGHISVVDNDDLNGYLNIMGSEKSGSEDKVALIDVGNFIDNGGTYSDMLEDGTLKLNRSGFEVRFADGAGVLTLNAGDGFRGFYVAKTSHPAEDALPYLDRNETEVYYIIKRLEEDGYPLPSDLEGIIQEVLNIDGKKDPGKVATALDFLGAVNYAVMMHNQIEGNLSHQRMLRNRSMVGRNLRHGKGCTDLYAAGFYNNQRLKYKFSHGEGYRRSEWGGMIGGDTCINENLRLGADIALGWSNISPTHNMKLKQRSLYWDVYAQFRKGNWRSLTSLGMGIHNFKLKRSLGDLYASKNNVRGLSLNISEEVTYDWKINEKTTIQPFAAVDLNWNRINSFTDGDIGGANMHVDRQTAFMAEFTLGGRYIRDFACVTDAPDATWYFQLGVAVAAGQLDSDMHCYFVGAPDYPFTIQAEERDRVGLDLGTGITIPVAQDWSVYGNAEVIFRGDSHHLNAQIGVQYAF